MGDALADVRGEHPRIGVTTVGVHVLDRLLTYELAAGVDEQYLSDLAARLKPASLNPSKHEQMLFAHNGGPVLVLEVMIDGAIVSLTIARDRVWASGAWLVEEREPVLDQFIG